MILYCFSKNTKIFTQKRGIYCFCWNTFKLYLFRIEKMENYLLCGKPLSRLCTFRGGWLMRMSRNYVHGGG